MLSRRTFLVRSAQLGTLFFLPTPFGRRAWADPVSTNDDHFFLQIVSDYPAGWDSSYLFDARPLEMTKANLIQNYTEAEPTLWKGLNGTETWASSVTKPLWDFKDCFSIVNGVHMSTLDGHDQNINFLFTGDPLGGDALIPLLNRAPSIHFSLDAVQRGQLRAKINNSSEIAPLSLKSAKTLVSALQSEPILDPKDPLNGYVAGRFAALSEGDGTLSLGSKDLKEALQSAPGLSRQFAALKLPEVAEESEMTFMTLVAQLFQQKVARSAILVLNNGKFKYDCHDPGSAKQQPEAFAAIVDKLTQIIKFLKTTPYDAKKSLLDVTTFSVGSEFARTMRQPGNPIDRTGTNHNPNTNSILIGGAGIRSNLVIGQSDFRTSTEKLSGAHMQMDRGTTKVVGKPFDFTIYQPSAKLPDAVNPDDYLNMGSVSNTLFALFGVAKDNYWHVQRNGSLAPVLNCLLK